MPDWSVGAKYVQAIKAHYVRHARAIGKADWVQGWLRHSRKAPAGSTRRWLASLLAVDDLDRMAALDCTPWTLAATRRISSFLDRREYPAIFEYGAGASTLWLARRAPDVVAVTAHAPVISQLGRHLDSMGLAHRVRMGVCPADPGDAGNGFAHAIQDVDGQFDLIIIDGPQRAACLALAQRRLKPGGAILLPDSFGNATRRAIADSRMAEIRFLGRRYGQPLPGLDSLLTPL